MDLSPDDLRLLLDSLRDYRIALTEARLVTSSSEVKQTIQDTAAEAMELSSRLISEIAARKSPHKR